MFPKCFPYWKIYDKKLFNDFGEPVNYISNVKGPKEITYSSRGFLLPCCWCDKAIHEEQLSQYGLFNEELKLENNDSVEDVLTSDIWRSFFKMLEDSDSIKPDTCIEKCSKLPTWGEDELRRLSESN